MTTILFAAHPDRWAQYEAPLRAALAKAGLGDATLTCTAAPQQVDYIVYAPNSDVQDFSVFPRLKAVLNLWAGVETVVGNPTLTVPLARMVDDGMREGMREYVAGHVLRHHLGMDAHIKGKPGGWQPNAPPLARDRTVAILGLGELGTACAEVLLALGFTVTGWSRSAKSIPGVTSFHGPDGLTDCLKTADIVVLLMPNTPATENTLNADTLAALPRGAVVINPGRGTLIDDEALLAALESGQIAHATLDVFRVEPLPEDHPYWRHPNVTVTPHIASETRPETASQVIAENVRRGEAGEPLLHLVNRRAGY
ncbi:2-hydroxyacid dehydrogenase [Nioella nitratireducens]|uniref:2-hydroxyacid dehydrogenase n=1 Tax=Nioella nitratireducens TaxID=1287720 RepID=UPI0008FD1402|nr:glyoxylate/hydroxypyruvate reductase A [Nioella nitratireducens]